MRWLQRCAALIAVGAAWAGWPAVGEAGWITLTSGSSGSAQPTGTNDFWYGSSSTLPLLAVDTLSGTGNVQAVTGGGSTFFTSQGTPVLLNLSDGSAYLAGGGPPSGVTNRGPDGESAGTLASAAPQAGVPAPDGYSRLSVAVTSDGSGAWVLTASVFGGSGEGLGSASVTVPEGGWWLLGMGSSLWPEPTPEPKPGPEPKPEPEPGPGPGPEPTPGVPEPGAAALVVSGGLAVLPWFRRRFRASRA